MRIAFDGSDLAAERFEGPSVYAGELVPRLGLVLTARGHAVTTYTPGPLADTLVAGTVRIIPGHPFWTQRTFSAALRADRPDVVFLPIQALPVFRPRPLATVAVVHDLEFLHYPQTYTAWNYALLRIFTRQAVQGATRLIAVSQYTKDDVVRTYGRLASDLTVVPHGVDHRRFAPEGRTPNANDGTSGAVRHRYRLPERFVLFVGALQPRKNIQGLVSAFEQLAEIEAELALVLVCGGSWREGEIRTRLNRSSVRSRIHLVRRVSPADLPALYRAASLFVLPSFSEGFGMPVLEAMACGTPVVTSGTSALPEVAGDAAVLVDPWDADALATAMARVLRDEAFRRTLVEKGLKRAAQFTWERSAEQTADVIEDAGGQFLSP